MAADVTYQIQVAKDDLAEDKYMVVIYRVSVYNGAIKSRIHGIPLRNVSRPEAYAMLAPLKFAFQYGVNAMQSALDSIRCDIEEI